MTYVAHRLLGLIVLTTAIVMTGCKSAQSDAQPTDGQQVQIPTPEPEAQVSTPATDSDVATLDSPSVTMISGEPIPSAPVATTDVIEEPKEPAITENKPEPAVEKIITPKPDTPTEVAQEMKPQPPAVSIQEAPAPAPAPLWSLKYPGDKEQFGGDLSMTVIQDRKSIKITNRTVDSYKDVQVWINQRYVTRVSDIPVGKTTSIALSSFINQYGEKYPTPGLFRPDRSFPALLVEIYQPDQNKRYRLIVQKTHSQF